MIWIIIIGIVIFILIKFSTGLNKDKDDLQWKSLPEKFNIVVNMINEVAFSGNGLMTTISKREFNLYEQGQNQIINFHYSTGCLTITWRYKYFQKEIIHKRHFSEVRNLSLFEQEKIAKIMIEEMNLIVVQHKNDVLNFE